MQTKKATYLEAAPAKINLSLKVKDKRDDGFHNLETIFQAIDLMDHLTFEISAEILDEGEKTEEIDFEILVDSNNEVVKNLGEENILVKAIEIFFAELSDSIIDKLAKFHIEVFIDKNIPLEAGLAGGSTNAAACLRALNQFFKENIGFEFNNEELNDMALILGSDVPFCLHSVKSSRLYAESRGERLFDLESKDLKKESEFFDQFKKLIVVKPSFGVSTREAFQLFDRAYERGTGQLDSKQDLNAINKHFYNNFEPCIEAKYPRISQVKDALKAMGAETALLSGSGSSVLGFFKEDEDLEVIHKDLESELVKQIGEEASSYEIFKSSFLESN